MSGFPLAPQVLESNHVPTHTYRDRHYEVIGGSKRVILVVDFAFFAPKFWEGAGDLQMIHIFCVCECSLIS